MSDIFKEVDEEVRRDKATEYWNKHGSKLIGAAVAIVLAVAGWRFYDDYQFKERAAMGATFESALAEAATANKDNLAGLTALAEKKSGTYPALARFRLASEIAAKAKDGTERANAVSAFDAIANDSAIPADWRDLAKIRAAFILVDSGTYDDVEKRLSPLVTADGAFRHSAREGIALAAYRAAKFDKAMDALQAIILDAESPAGVRQRAELLLAVVRSGPVPKS